MKRYTTMLLAIAAAVLVIAGCDKSHEHPKGEHPKGEHPAKKEAVKKAAPKKAEHPEHPKKAEHPEHPK